MEKALKVKDQFRTNDLSLKPGGYEVTVIHENGKIFIYDKIKNPGMYIKSISAKSKNGPIVEIKIDGETAWTTAQMGTKNKYDINL